MTIDLQKVNDSEHLLDILIQMEDVLDSMDVYVFKNWFSGEVVEGPTVKRYWLDFTIRYDYDKMPDPKAALRLLKHGVRVDYKKVMADGNRDKSATSMSEETDEEKSRDPDFWDVRISIPRRLIGQFSSTELDFYDEEVDVDDVVDAKDEGITDDSAYREEDQDEPQTP